MATSGGNAPSWLFSFVDLAFLLLIAMTQLASDAAPVPELGEIIVPRIQADGSSPLEAGAVELWQLRVHPKDAEAAGPFELARSGGEVDVAQPERLAEPALRERLAELKRTGEDKPLLAPHEDSRSQDLLDAVASIEELWPSRRRATIAPFLAAR